MVTGSSTWDLLGVCLRGNSPVSWLLQGDSDGERDGRRMRERASPKTWTWHLLLLPSIKQHPEDLQVHAHLHTQSHMQSKHTHTRETKSTHLIFNTWCRHTSTSGHWAKAALREAVPERDRLNQVLLTLSGCRHGTMSKAHFPQHLLLPN